MRFQYHTGSIQTFLFIWIKIVDVAHFNTTLVLFKLECSSFRTLRIKSFQYHTGSIQTKVINANILNAITNFNTTLVLFKLFVWQDIAHYILHISIPHWFYSNFKLKRYTSQVYGISIPHWFYSNQY